MPRYIDADKLPITTVAIQPYALIEKPYNAEVVFAQAIKAAPTADVREVVHCHIVHEKGGWLTCSNCHILMPQLFEIYRFYYCPNCGAMIEEEQSCRDILMLID